MSRTGFPDGFHVRYQEQDYWPLGTREYVNPNGQRMVAIEWRTACPDCGRSFTVTTGRQWNRPHARRCSTCRAPGRAGPTWEST
jgi:transposase-like protein